MKLTATTGARPQGQQKQDRDECKLVGSTVPDPKLELDTREDRVADDEEPEHAQRRQWSRGQHQREGECDGSELGFPNPDASVAGPGLGSESRRRERFRASSTSLTSAVGAAWSRCRGRRFKPPGSALPVAPFRYRPCARRPVAGGAWPELCKAKVSVHCSDAGRLRPSGSMDNEGRWQPNDLRRQALLR